MHVNRREFLRRTICAALGGAGLYSALGNLRLVITGVGLLFVLLALPGGFGQIIVAARDRALRYVAVRRNIHVPEFGNEDVEPTEPADGLETTELAAPDSGIRSQAPPVGVGC